MIISSTPIFYVLQDWFLLVINIPQHMFCKIVDHYEGLEHTYDCKSVSTMSKKFLNVLGNKIFKYVDGLRGLISICLIYMQQKVVWSSWYL